MQPPSDDPKAKKVLALYSYQKAEDGDLDLVRVSFTLIYASLTADAL